MSDENNETLDRKGNSSALDLLLSVRARNAGEAIRHDDVVLFKGRFVRVGFHTEFDHYYAGNNVTNCMHHKVFCVDR